MTAFPLLASGFIMTIVAVLFVICSIVLVLVVLIQKGRGGGLSGAFGGAMASGILGSKTGDFLTWVTIVLVGVYLILAIVMAKFFRPEVSDFGSDQVSQQQASPTQEQTVPIESSETEIGGDEDSNIVDGTQAVQPIQPTDQEPTPTGGEIQAFSEDVSDSNNPGSPDS